ncbi:MAG: YraN family protein [Gammaproteobacteria bacterium]|nr:YraN family protein [Gammaproteobacteria bacterium]NIR98307.1 YraN family protein [Gammaproteobacteria bacterium]NIT64054.1 YraN family protein [Gammaproteobacteria bacterium]NIV20985.1 YraN family protein [Gammaproteobacteria bacterium]NIX10382.1 YraN family protein [Gammaproteobacteria bacterium]
MPGRNVAQGRRAEQLACEHLESRGLRPVARNYRCKAGELDLIMEEADTLVFVEVRFRRNTRYGSGTETVDRRKRAKVIAAASHYLQRCESRGRACRFDVVSITTDRRAFAIQWIRDAFSA